MTPLPGDVSPSRGRYRIALIGFLAIAGFFLLTEHTAHVLAALPYVLVLLCPLMHLFHHHGHEHEHHGREERNGGPP